MSTAKLALVLFILVTVIGGGIWGVHLYLRSDNGGISHFDTIEPLTSGVSIVYEIRSPDDEVQAMQANLDQLYERIANATNEAEKKAVGGQADRLEAEIRSAQAGRKPDAELVKDIIAILKQRADAEGGGLVWRPIGHKRFEVRMPHPAPGVGAAKEAYLQAIDDIRSRNIGKVDLMRLKAGQTTVERLAGDDEKLTQLVDALLEAHKALEQKRESGEPKIQRYIYDLETAELELSKYNVNLVVLKNILSNYVNARTLETARNNPHTTSELRRKQARYNRAVRSFTARYPARSAAIEKVVKLHRTWADVHKPLHDPDDLTRLISRSGALEFRIAPVRPDASGEDQDTLSDAELGRYINILRNTLDTEGPAGLVRRTDRYLWFPLRPGQKSGYTAMITSRYDGVGYLLLSNVRGKTLLQQRYRDKWSLTDAFWSNDGRGLPAVGFKMNRAGGELLHALTAGNMGRHMAILLNDEVYSAPVIQSAISGSGIITMGEFNAEKTGRLIKMLRAGALPATVNPQPVSITPFGPAQKSK